MAIQDFTKAWKSDTNKALHSEFEKNPAAILDKYNVTGTDRASLIEACKKGGCTEVDRKLGTIQQGGQTGRQL